MEFLLFLLWTSAASKRCDCQCKKEAEKIEEDSIPDKINQLNHHSIYVSIVLLILLLLVWSVYQAYLGMDRWIEIGIYIFWINIFGYFIFKRK